MMTNTGHNDTSINYYITTTALYPEMQSEDESSAADRRGTVPLPRGRAQ